MAVMATTPTPPGRIERYRLALVRIGLPAWFIAIDLLWIVKPITFAIDARHYQRAASAWLTGGDPWEVYESGVQFAAGPHTLLAYAPTHVLSLPIATAAWMLIGLGVAVWIVRRLRLPIWWLAFPPLFHAVWNGNPQTVMLALLLLRTPVAAALAAAVKLYALVPLLFRPRQLLAAGAFLAVTALVVPWQLYLASGGGVAEHIAGAWDGSAWRIPVLVIPAAAALWILRRHGAEWWSIPTLWPATQFYYGSTVLPVIAGRPVLAALCAVPAPLLVPAIVMFLAVARLLEQRRPGVVPESVRRALEMGDASIPA